MECLGLALRPSPQALDGVEDDGLAGGEPPGVGGVAQDVELGAEVGPHGLQQRGL
eukprot:CAMPEP_0119133966 /NCGR_PEP_ID=MMETSP1310-20130426/14863_1 /TAXON_ID=464262 /ORGANISM="Genus nov. species nov., Strain RCC2339" /LENGTH=54 /DNA_ID=CAMNT_0007124703 /DNA_START=24 /DNA_END=185 /DNA_ORIENTATION=-